MSSNIPHARDLLKTALSCDMSDEARLFVQEALGHMTRRFVKIKAPVEARRVTRGMARAILRYYEMNPEMSCRLIGEHFGVNQGRVSEIIGGGYACLEDYKE